MREIKFRGRRFDNNEWIYGSLLDGDIMSSVHQETVGQYTGLKDCNGKDIYEGDRWQNEGGWSFVVEYDERSAGFLPFVTDDGCGCCASDTREAPERGEVIGNIHEHPHLLGDNGQKDSQ